MAKGNKAPRFPVKPTKAPSAAQVKGEYTVPPERQQLLRDLHRKGGELERQLGQLRVEHLLHEGRLMQELQENTRRYETQVREAATTGELDFSETPWDFDLTTMTFRRRGGPSPAESAPPTPPQQSANGGA